MRDKEAAVIYINYSGLFFHIRFILIFHMDLNVMFETDHGTPGPIACVGLVVGD